MLNLHTTAFSLAILALLSGCSDGTSNANTSESSTQENTPTISTHTEKPIKLKNLTIGENIKNIKNAKRLSNKSHIFDIEYFGKKTTFKATTNDKGQIYLYDANLDGSFDELKTALEEKFTTENSKSIAFECWTNTFQPDSSVEIRDKLCSIYGQSEKLSISEKIIQPTAKISGIPKLPTTIISIKLEGTALKEEAKAAEDKAYIERERIADEQRKKDL